MSTRESRDVSSRLSRLPRLTQTGWLVLAWRWTALPLPAPLPREGEKDYRVCDYINRRAAFAPLDVEALIRPYRCCHAPLSDERRLLLLLTHMMTVAACLQDLMNKRGPGRGGSSRPPFVFGVMLLFWYDTSVCPDAMALTLRKRSSCAVTRA